MGRWLDRPGQEGRGAGDWLRQADSGRSGSWISRRRPSVTFLADGVDNAVATALSSASGKNIEIFGANTAQQCLQAHLLDEIVNHLAPCYWATASGSAVGPVCRGSTWNEPCWSSQVNRS